MAYTIDCRAWPHDSATVIESLMLSSSRRAAWVPTWSSTRSPGPGAAWATRTSRSPNVARSSSSSSWTRPSGSLIRISTMPCFCASVSMRETFERLVPMSSAISACDRPST